MWKDGKWQYVGEVMSQGGVTEKKPYDGDRFFPKGDYDYVFDVDVADGAPKAKLPYNEGDNQLVVAEKFLIREGMHLAYKEQITDFIRKNTSGRASSIPGGHNPKPQAATKPKSCFPMRHSVFFQDTNMDGLWKKIQEFQCKILEGGEATKVLALTDTELKYLHTLVVKLRDPALYAYIKEFTCSEIDAAKKVAKWPAEFYVPIMDLWRCIVMHHASQKFFSGVDSGMPIIAALVGKLRTGPPVIWNVFFKFLSNLFIQTVNMTASVRAKDIIQEAFKLLNKGDNKTVALVANYLMNCSSALDCISQISDSFIDLHISYISDLVQHANLTPEALLKLAIALGNFANFRPSAAGQAKNVMMFFIEKMEKATDDTSKQILETFKHYGV